MRQGEDFEEFYRASYGRVVAVVAAVLGDRHEAEEAAQEAFARALARWPRLSQYDLPEAWIRRVALRIAIDTGGTFTDVVVMTGSVYGVILAGRIEDKSLTVDDDRTGSLRQEMSAASQTRDRF